ncbi:MAG: glycosyltransferase family 2 protein [Bacteroidales bacterium]|nr:glycosyltransferase family 2 protein [Bacteroidales bacterium]MBN2758824.1 glycosyltransferase family 2 protein [Bacteroidales bacterium]
MDRKVALTAIIPTLNEEHNIRDVIESVSFADEIIVVDSFSTDNTFAIAKETANKVIQHDYKNSAAQKNWIIPQAKHEWILIIDADERVTMALRDEIIGVLESKSKINCYWIYRANFFMGRKIKFSGWQNDRVIRLFKRDLCRYEHKQVHAEIIPVGKAGTLKNKILHNTYTNIDNYVNKLNRYAWWQANDLYNGKFGHITFFHIIIKPFYRFVYHYFIKLGIFDGIPGFTISILNSYAVGTRYIKLWLKRKKLE